jgi:prophage regulatory protein
MPHDAKTAIALPATGYIRQAQLIGVSEVAPEDAARNRERGKGPRRPRKGVAGVLPWSSATLWRKVGIGAFPAPDKLSERITAWNVEKVLAWLADQSAQPPAAAPTAVPAVAGAAVPAAVPVNAAPTRRRGRPRKHFLTEALAAEVTT